MKYPIGTKIGEFTVIGHKGQYILKCSCGNTAKGPTTFVSRACMSLAKLGFAGCQKCRYDFLRDQKMNSAEKYSTIYCRYRKSAKNRGLEFTLSLEEAAKLFSSSCVYCGDKPTNTCIRTSLMTYNYTGIDRLDNNLGYIQDNVVPCCQNCNLAKYTKSPKDFLKHIEKIYDWNLQRLSRKGVESSDSK